MRSYRASEGKRSGVCWTDVASRRQLAYRFRCGMFGLWTESGSEPRPESVPMPAPELPPELVN